MEAERAGLALTVVHEPVIQGTGGGIRGLRPLLAGEELLVVFNGDILFPLDLTRVVAEHRARGAEATLVLMPMPAGERYASVECDGQGRVWRIAGHGPGGNGLSPWHFAGVHVMSPRVFDFMSESGPEDINREVYPRLMAQGLVVHGARVQGYWSDLGTPGRYLDAQEDVLCGKVDLSGLGDDSPLFGARELSPGCWVRGAPRIEGRLVSPVLVDAGAEVEAGAVVGPVGYIGPGATIGPGVQLSRAAVLGGGMVEGDAVHRAIIWPQGRVQAT
jgi:mannose-1-phosphate guanylyltransferase